MTWGCRAEYDVSDVERRGDIARYGVSDMELTQGCRAEYGVSHVECRRYNADYDVSDVELYFYHSSPTYHGVWQCTGNRNIRFLISPLPDQPMKFCFENVHFKHIGCRGGGIGFQKWA